MKQKSKKLLCILLTLSLLVGMLSGLALFVRASDPSSPPPGSPPSGTGTSSRYVKAYTVTDVPSAHGAVTTDKVNASVGSRVLVIVTPDDGYMVSAIIVVDADGNVIPVTSSNGSYYFEMPENSVSVSATFIKKIALPTQTGVADKLDTGNHIIYLRGYPDGSIQPYGNITRAEAAMALFRLLKSQDVTITESYLDVPKDAWYAEAVLKLASLGIINGYQGGSFKPNQPITRAEFAAATTRFSDVKGGTVEFSDVPSDFWAKDNIATAAAYGWINGYDDGTFRPNGLIRRAEAATIVNHMLYRIADASFVLSNRSELVQFTDLQDPTAWYYLDMVESSTAHVFDVISGVEKWKK